MKKSLQELVRPNIWKLKPYSSARDEYNGATASVFLDANENPYNNPHNRYPDPLQRDLKVHLSQIKKVPAENIFIRYVLKSMMWSIGKYFWTNISNLRLTVCWLFPTNIPS